MLYGRKTRVNSDSKIGGRELWQGKREAKVKIEIAQELTRDVGAQDSVWLFPG